MFESTGRLVYDPAARIKPEPYWLILKTDRELVHYYQHWIKQNYDLKFVSTVWGSHVSVVRGTKPNNLRVWNKYQGKQITFKYSNNIYRKHWFFCIDVQCPELEDIREELGLSRVPASGFHLTVGRIDRPYILRKQELWTKFVESLKLKEDNVKNDKSLYPLIKI
jgi:hypothetical protein